MFSINPSRLVFILALLSLVSTPLSGANQADEPAFIADVDVILNAHVEQGSFSGSVLIAKDGKVLLSKGYGMANLEHDAPNTPQTKFRIGSITKQFTAMAILQLQQRGKLNVQDSICKYVSNCPKTWQPITIHQLLTHTSGIHNYTNNPDFFELAVKPTTLEKLIDPWRKWQLDFKPGSKFSYSNSGYVLLGYIIEKASGKSYDQFLQENIFQPLGMINTGYDNNRVLKNRAQGYSDRITNAPYVDMSVPHAAGALYSTVEDLYL